MEAIPVIGHNKIIDSLGHPEMRGTCWKEIPDGKNQTSAPAVFVDGSYF
jgi:hypothetical protein